MGRGGAASRRLSTQVSFCEQGRGGTEGDRDTLDSDKPFTPPQLYELLT